MTIKLAGMELEHPIMVAPGMVKTLAEFEAAVNSSASAIVLGSLTGTYSERVGNPEPRSYYDHELGYMLNAMGLPDPGLDYYDYWHSRWLMLLGMAREAGKRVILSFAPMEYPVGWYGLLKHFKDWQLDAIELNLGCPNVWSERQQKMILSFDIEGIETHLLDLATFWRGPIGLKVSPYSNPVELAHVAERIAGLAAGTVENRLYIASTNTFPNALVVDDGKPYLSTKYGGFSGPAYKPIALGQVLQWVEALRGCGSPIPVVGVGGITSGSDVSEFLACGAAAVQVAANYWQYGPSSMERLVAQWVDT